MWHEHWGLRRDPFQDAGSPYVPLAGHEEAVARLLHLIETAEPVGFLRGAPGSGKSRVLGRTLDLARKPNRRFAMAAGPMDRAEAVAGLARKLGGPPVESATEAVAWQSLRRALDVCRVQGSSVVLILEKGREPDVAREEVLRGLIGLSSGTGRVTVIGVGDGENDAEECEGDLPCWSLRIRLARLTLSEADRYVRGRLESAGCPEPLFSPRAMTRLHALSGGTPRGLDRLASLSLMAAAVRRLEAVPSELVDDVSRECRIPAGFALSA